MGSYTLGPGHLATELQGVNDRGRGAVDEGYALRAVIRPDASHYHVEVLQTCLRCCSVAGYAFDDVGIEGGRVLEVWERGEDFATRADEDVEG